MSTDWSSTNLDTPPPPKSRPTILLWALGCSGILILSIGLAATLLVPNILEKVTSALTAKIHADLATIDAALDAYAARNNGVYPDSLEALIRHDVNGVAFLDPLPLDPWKRAYIYEPPKSPGAKPRVLTFGHDGKPGGADLDADVDDSTVRSR